MHLFRRITRQGRELGCNSDRKCYRAPEEVYSNIFLRFVSPFLFSLALLWGLLFKKKKRWASCSVNKVYSHALNKCWFLIKILKYGYFLDVFACVCNFTQGNSCICSLLSYPVMSFLLLSRAAYNLWETEKTFRVDCLTYVKKHI